MQTTFSLKGPISIHQIITQINCTKLYLYYIFALSHIKE
jgi:hypothetical protein